MPKPAANDRGGSGGRVPDLSAVDPQKYINELMLRVRSLVVEVEDEQTDLKQKLDDLVASTAPSSTNSSESYLYSPSLTTATASPTDEPSATTATLSTGCLSSVITTNSTKPPSYKTAVKPTDDSRGQTTTTRQSSTSRYRDQQERHTHSQSHQNHHHHHHNHNPNHDHLLHHNHDHHHHHHEPPPQRPPRTRTRLQRSTTLPRQGATTNASSSTQTSDTTENLRKLNKHIISILNRTTMASNGITRGALIVLEGLDRVGKSTLAAKLCGHLERIKVPVSHCRFPDRTTPVGQLIDTFLKNGTKRVDDHTMHLLFSANRWELDKSIRHSIAQGTTVILDRYSYSGIAYSSTKTDLTMEWCRNTERGLPKPDLVIYLELPKEAQYKRPGFGDERFETEEHQEIVRQQYEQIIASSQEKWLRIDVENKSPDQVLGEIIIPVKRCLESSANTELGDLEFR